MRALATIILVSVMGSVSLSAEPPKKTQLSKYRKLWEQSLVTEKPIVEVPEEEEEISELDDYSLGGYSRTSQGYFVSLINTKDPKLRLTIGAGVPGSQAYEVLEIKSDPLNFTKAEVLVKLGNKQKWIGYDEKNLTIRQPAAAKPTPKNPASKQPAARNNNNQATPTPPAAGSTNNRRQPRVRRVPVPPKK